MTPLRSRIVFAIATFALLTGLLWLDGRRDTSALCVRDGKTYSHGAYVKTHTGAAVCEGGRWVAPSGAGARVPR